jgi:hypothetical protein
VPEIVVVQGAGVGPGRRQGVRRRPLPKEIRRMTTSIHAGSDQAGHDGVGLFEHGDRGRDGGAPHGHYLSEIQAGTRRSTTAATEGRPRCGGT